MIVGVLLEWIVAAAAGGGEMSVLTDSMVKVRLAGSGTCVPCQMIPSLLKCAAVSPANCAVATLFHNTMLCISGVVLYYTAIQA